MRSLRVRFSVAFAVTAGVVCLVIGLVVYRDTSDGLFARARDQAAQEARAARDGSIAGRLPLGSQTDTSSVPPALVARVGEGRVATIVRGDRVWAGAPVAGHGVYVSGDAVPYPPPGGGGAYPPCAGGGGG